ncbi:MAG: MBL fold metallo-hydrolase [Fimbriimonadaceae bacterium]|nr:MBL fold metallo-hydrolase [Alphaproteobacteria bacterium]
MLIIDAGSGIRQLGFDLNARNVKDIDLLFGHFHYDHIIGFPCFSPIHDNSVRVRVWAGDIHGGMNTFEIITQFMRPPFFPVGPDVFRASVDYRDFKTGDTLDFGDGIKIQTGHLTHPGGCTGYRVEYDNRSVAYISDHEHIPGVENKHVMKLIDQADIVIYDATYTDEELPEFTGYGHSTWREGVRICKLANAKKLFLFHHRPKRNDQQLRAIEAQAQQEFTNTFAARDGLEINV